MTSYRKVALAIAAHPDDRKENTMGRPLSVVAPEWWDYTTLQREILEDAAGLVAEYTASYDDIRCVIVQGGRGETKHWAFNAPPRRSGKYGDEPMPPEEYKALPARVVDLPPVTIIQNARTTGAGQVSSVPTQALTVGAVETFKAERVSIWRAGTHDNPFGMRLTTLMISKKLIDTSVPMSLLALHPQRPFQFLHPRDRRL